MKARVPIILGLLALMTVCYAEELPFKLQGTSSVTALVGDESLDLDMALGNAIVYPEQGKAASLEFHLIAGGCDVEIFGYRAKNSDVNFQIGQQSYIKPTGFRVTKDGVQIFDNGGPKNVSCSGSLAFKKLDDGNVTVSVELKGSVPPGLSLTSKTAKIFDPKLHGGKSGFPVWAIILICATVALLILTAGIAVFLYIRHRRKKQARVIPKVVVKSEAKTEVKAGAKVEQKPVEQAPKPIEKLASVKKLKQSVKEVVKSIGKKISMKKAPEKKNEHPLSEDSVEPASLTAPMTDKPVSKATVPTQKTSEHSLKLAPTPKDSLSKKVSDVKTAKSIPSLPRPPLTVSIKHVKHAQKRRIDLKDYEISRLQGELDIERNEGEALANEVFDLEHVNQKLEDKGKKLGKKVTDLTKVVATRGQEVEALKMQDEEKGKKLAQYKARYDALKAKLSSCKCDKPSNPCADCKKDKEKSESIKIMMTQSSSSNSGTRPTTTECSTDTKTVSADKAMNEGKKGGNPEAQSKAPLK